MSAELPRGGAMECDGPDQTRPVSVRIYTESREGLHRLDDSILYELAADVIDGWTPPRVDLLVEALRDRSAQFAGIEQFAEQTLRPIWVPEDAAQAARDAAAHVAESVGVELPFRRNPNSVCPCCSAWPRDKCEPFCLSEMTPDEQEQHRSDVLYRCLAELHIGPIAVEMRPRRARQINRLLLGAAVLLLALAAIALVVGAR